MKQCIKFGQLLEAFLLISFLLGTTSAIGRFSEPILSNEIEHDGSQIGETGVPTGLVGSADVPMTDIPGKPLDPNDFGRDEVLQTYQAPVINGEDPIMAAGLFQGDIVIPNMETLQYINSHSVNGKPPFKNAITNAYNKWPNAEIPYAISSRFNDKERSTIARAMAAFHKSTCIRFVPRKGHRDYVYLTGGSGCSSAVGRVGGQQSVTLGNGCVYDGIVMHELMHAAGFWHEQSRADRDSFISINWSNIQRGMAYNFEKYEWGFIQNLSVAYDTGSIMHYGPYSFAIDRSKPTIIANDGVQLGQREGLSQKDKNKLNRLYECGGTGGGGGGGGGGSVTTTTTTVPIVTGTCEDSNQHCQYWSSIGECEKNSDWMHANCQKSCNKCTSGDCFDSDKYCGFWSQVGQCDKNPDWMNENCRKSCSRCGAVNECKNENMNCDQWNLEGHCKISEFYMSNYCKLACNICDINSNVNGQCADKDEFCQTWAKKGECQKNPDWMLENCKKSCGHC